LPSPDKLPGFKMYPIDFEKVLGRGPGWDSWGELSTDGVVRNGDLGLWSQSKPLQ
jgi:hypothetical protein